MGNKKTALGAISLNQVKHGMAYNINRINGLRRSGRFSRWQEMSQKNDS
jgi:hypothetical protein